ncbi:hypothetical protein BT63DRAFT_159697 [Microthyrium microscopicum]|uniref:Uncharacterized protein n=1 Tax=Microthyrium microscopicum TaxID=703497 RepID=A0A6A6UMS4_9PEZI|nr:hypothetical protein BT63DRAFT_159697 [Microthyrium microscopicum]
MLEHKVVLLGSLVAISLAVNSTQVVQFDSFCACLVLRSLTNTTNGPDADVIRQNLVIDPADRAQCDSWTGFPNYTITVFIDQFGKPTSGFAKAVGIRSKDLYRFCGRPIKQVHNTFRYAR